MLGKRELPCYLRRLLPPSPPRAPSGTVPSLPPISLEEEALLLKYYATKLQHMGRELRLPHRVRVAGCCCRHRQPPPPADA